MRRLMFLCLLLIMPLFAHALEEGEKVPSLVLDQINSNGVRAAHSITARDARARTGYKVLEFFSTTSPASQRNLPVISELANEFKDQVTFRLISVDRDSQKVRNYISQNRSLVHYDVALDYNRKAVGIFNIRYVPILFVLDENDRIVIKINGVISSGDKNQLRQLFNNE